MSDQLAPTFANLHLLGILAQTRSFTQAARRLGVSKASVSARISDLEREIGVPLVRRTTRSVVLTEAGAQLVADMDAPFARIAQSVADIKDLAGSARGLVRVTVPVALGRQTIAPMLGSFIRGYPDIRLEIELTDRFVNLAQEGFDLAIRHTQALPDTYVALSLCETRSMLVASPRYLQEHGTPAHPSNLATRPCLLYLRDGYAMNWTLEKRKAGVKGAERANIPVTGPLKANNSEVLREAALDGLGIALLPDFTALHDVQAGRLACVLPEWRPVGFFGENLYAVRPWTARTPRAVQCFVDHLRAEFAKRQQDLNN